MNSLISFLKNNRNIEEWSIPFEGCVIFVSYEGYKDLSGMFMEFFGGNIKFILTGLDVSATAGRLPNQTWSWLSTKVGKSYRFEDDEPFPELPLGDQNP